MEIAASLFRFRVERLLVNLHHLIFFKPLFFLLNQVLGSGLFILKLNFPF